MGQDNAGAFRQPNCHSPRPTASRTSHGNPPPPLPPRNRPLGAGGAPPSYSAHMLKATGESVGSVQDEGWGVNERSHPISRPNYGGAEAEAAPPSYQAHIQQRPGAAAAASSSPPRKASPPPSRKIGSDALFGPAKWAVQRACGQKKDAKKTMKNFNDTNPVALVSRSVYHRARGDRKMAGNLSRQGAKNTMAIFGGVVNAIPLVGHAKGLAHYVCGDKSGGHKAMHSATRSTTGFIGAAGGVVAGGPTGAVLGYMAGTNATDALVSVADSAVSKEVRLHGNLDKIKTVVQNPSVGNAFEAGLGVTMDLFGGMAVGAGIGEAMGGADTAAGGVEVSGMDAGGGDGWDGCVPDIGGADGAGGRPEVDIGGPNSLDAAPGEDLAFIGDEAKFSRDAFRATKEHFSGGVAEGLGKMDELLGDFGDKLPDDMKWSGAGDGRLGVDAAERLTNLEAAPVTGSDGLLAAALVPDKKRDYLQDDGLFAAALVPDQKRVAEGARFVRR